MILGREPARDIAVIGGALMVGIAIGVLFAHLAKPKYEDLIEEVGGHSARMGLVSLSSLKNRVKIPISSIDLTVDRHEFLRRLFAHVTNDDKTDQEKIESWVDYLQERIVDPVYTPEYDDGQAITDPVWILRNRIGLCGQVNRVVVDGLAAGGYRARLVQLNGHVGAEVWLNGGWKYLDADLLSYGEFIRDSDGSLLSAEEISHDPKKFLSAMPLGMEFKLYPGNRMSVGFDERMLRAYVNAFTTKPYYYVKTATPEQERNVYFGWNYFKTVRN